MGWEVKFELSLKGKKCESVWQEVCIKETAHAKT